MFGTPNEWQPRTFPVASSHPRREKWTTRFLVTLIVAIAVAFLVAIIAY